MYPVGKTGINNSSRKGGKEFLIVIIGRGKEISKSIVRKERGGGNYN